MYDEGGSVRDKRDLGSFRRERTVLKDCWMFRFAMTCHDVHDFDSLTVSIQAASKFRFLGPSWCY